MAVKSIVHSLPTELEYLVLSDKQCNSGDHINGGEVGGASKINKKITKPPNKSKKNVEIVAQVRQMNE